jgi:hypothetical protein
VDSTITKTTRVAEAVVAMAIRVIETSKTTKEVALAVIPLVHDSYFIFQIRPILQSHVFKKTNTKISLSVWTFLQASSINRGGSLKVEIM